MKDTRRTFRIFSYPVSPNGEDDGETAKWDAIVHPAAKYWSTGSIIRSSMVRVACNYLDVGHGLIECPVRGERGEGESRAAESHTL